MEGLLGNLGYVLMGYLVGIGTMCLMFISKDNAQDEEIPVRLLHRDQRIN